MTSQKQEETSTSPDPQQKQEFIPRAFFIQGLPQDETTKNVTGRQMHDLIRKFIIMDKTLQQKYQLFFDRNVHRKIRDGSFLILFDSTEEAQKVWNSKTITADDEEFIKIKIPLAVLLSSTTQQQEQENENENESSFFTLSISWSAGKLRDHFFPLLPYSIRRNILMDPTATFSLTDMLSANRMAKLICDAILVPPTLVTTENNDDKGREERKISICDAFACVGGNSFGFLSAAAQKNSTTKNSVEVTSIELDNERCSMLQENYKMMLNGGKYFLLDDFKNGKQVLKIHNGCSLQYLANELVKNNDGAKIFDVLFFDPPWGGPTEMKKSKETSGFPKFSISKNDCEVLFPTTSSDGINENAVEEQNVQKEVLFEDLVASLVLHKNINRIASVIAIKLPSEKWCEQDWMQKLVRRCVFDESEENDENTNTNQNNNSRERVFPLLFNFGASMRLLCFVQNSIQNIVSGIVSNKTLDDLVSRVWRFNVEEGFREMKPRYYDFEKKRWIELKKWLGSKEE